MMELDITLPFGIRFRLALRRGPDLLDIVSALWSAQPPPCEHDHDHL
ncbi:hypothetical protein [Nocardia asteroides]